MLSPWGYTYAQGKRTKAHRTKQIEMQLTEQFLASAKIVLTVGNLNTNSTATLYALFPSRRTRKLAERLEIRYTPKTIS